MTGKLILLPAMSAKKGKWDYCITRMAIRDVVENIEIGLPFPSDEFEKDGPTYGGKTLRVPRDVIELAHSFTQSNTMLNSMTAVAIGGRGQFHQIDISSTDGMEFVPKPVANAFGFIGFDGTQKFYLLDDKKTLRALRYLYRESQMQVPEGFFSETLSVSIIVLNELDEISEDTIKDLKKMSLMLKRNSKISSIVNYDENILEDQEDAFAILTRKLMGQHDFFKNSEKWHFEWKQKNEYLDYFERVQTTKKPINAKFQGFTSLQTLYAMNRELLTSVSILNRVGNGWGPDEDGRPIYDTNQFIRFRPTDELLDEMYESLSTIWTAIVSAIPDLENDPVTMRNHNPGDNDYDSQDHFLFWPIGQDLVLAPVVRYLLDNRLPDKTINQSDLEECINIISPLNKIDWDLHSRPWEYWLLKGEEQLNGPDKFSIRNEDRSKIIKSIRALIYWWVGISDWDGGDKEDFFFEYKTQLLRPQTSEWEDIAIKQITAIWEKFDH